METISAFLILSLSLISKMYKLSAYKVTIIQQVSEDEQTDSSVSWLETPNLKDMFSRYKAQIMQAI